MGRVERKTAFENAQNAQIRIIMRTHIIRDVALYSYILKYPMLADSEDSD